MARSWGRSRTKNGPFTAIFISHSRGTHLIAMYESNCSVRDNSHNIYSWHISCWLSRLPLMLYVAWWGIPGNGFSANAADGKNEDEKHSSIGVASKGSHVVFPPHCSSVSTCRQTLHSLMDPLILSVFLRRQGLGCSETIYLKGNI